MSLPSGLSIKGAGSATQGNVVEVTGLVNGTTAEDVAAIFKRCGTITQSKLMPEREVTIRLTFKTPASALSAVQKFNNQPADGKTLSVRIVGSSSAGTTLGGRLGGPDGLGVVHQEGSVDVLMDADTDSGSCVFYLATFFLVLSFLLGKCALIHFSHRSVRIFLLLHPAPIPKTTHNPEVVVANGNVVVVAVEEGGEEGAETA